MNIKNSGEFIGGNIIGGAIGNVFANVDQYDNFGDFVIDLGKGSAFSGGVQASLYGIS